VYPGRGPFNSDLPTDDRLAMSGQPLHIVTPLLEFRGDWPAVVELLAMRSWKHKFHPCPCCTAAGDELYDFTNLSLENSGWEAWTQSDHELEILRCKKVVRNKKHVPAYCLLACRCLLTLCLLVCVYE
jgi:hypothetical protein